MFPADTFKAIADLAQAAKAPVKVEIPRDPTKIFIAYNGAMQEVEINEPLPSRLHVVETMADLVEAVKHWGGKGKGPSIWHSSREIVAILEGDRRIDRAVMRLHRSAPLRSLMELDKKTVPMNQRDTIRFLRHNMVDCVHEEIVEAFRVLKFERTESMEAEQRKHRQSLGRSVEAEISSAQDLPDEIVFDVPIYRNTDANWRRKIICTVDVDLQAERIIISPKPDEIEQAVQYVHGEIGGHLRKALPEVPVFFGTPEPVQRSGE